MEKEKRQQKTLLTADDDFNCVNRDAEWRRIGTKILDGTKVEGAGNEEGVMVLSTRGIAIISKKVVRHSRADMGDSLSPKGSNAAQQRRESTDQACDMTGLQKAWRDATGIPCQLRKIMQARRSFQLTHRYHKIGKEHLAPMLSKRSSFDR